MKFVCLFLLVSIGATASAQESYMRWDNQDFHTLGVYMQVSRYWSDRVDTIRRPIRQRAIIIQDTFRFTNMAKETLVIRKMHVSKPSCFTFTERTAPGKQGTIVYSDTVYPGGEGIYLRRLRFNVMTNFSPWVMIGLSYAVVDRGAKVLTYPNGDVRMATAHQHMDSAIQLQLHCAPGMLPKAMGTLFLPGNQKTGVWHYWAEDGSALPDTTHTKKIFVGFAGETYGSLLDPQVLAYKGGKWYKPLSGMNTVQHFYFIEPGTDTIRFELAAASNEIAIPFQSLAEGQVFSNAELMKSGVPHYYAYGMRKPVYFSDSSCFFTVEQLRVCGGNPQDYLSVLQRRYPQLRFDVPYPASPDLCRFTRRPGDRLTLPHYIQALQKESCIRQFYIALLPSTAHSPADFVSPLLYMPLRNLNRSEDADSILNLFGFKRDMGRVDPSGYYYLNYTRRVVDALFIEQYNALMRHRIAYFAPLQFHYPVRRYISPLEMKD